MNFHLISSEKLFTAQNEHSSNFLVDLDRGADARQEKRKTNERAARGPVLISVPLIVSVTVLSYRCNTPTMFTLSDKTESRNSVLTRIRVISGGKAARREGCYRATSSGTRESPGMRSKREKDGEYHRERMELRQRCPRTKKDRALTTILSPDSCFLVCLTRHAETLSSINPLRASVQREQSDKFAIVLSFRC